LAERVAARSADELKQLFSGADVCCTIVASLEEAMVDPQFVARNVFGHALTAGPHTIPALPVPVADVFRSSERAATYPLLGEANELVSGKTAS
jgi:crotonobetainyl-CoA:carnitine CoA-transferase CaiB-like acyl-CoA transferase